MCGIAGFVGKGSETELRKMVHALSHRGPDGQGFFVKENVGFGHTRLAILDTSARGAQPMWNKEQTLAIVFNGEIYNFKSLRGELEKSGVVCTTGTDTEVILRLYEQEGEKCFSQLAGMFAIALFDFSRKRLVLARDRMGEKPLYVATREEGLVFASELRALIDAGAVSKTIDPLSFEQYLLFDYVPAPRTILSGVSKLSPGTYLVWEKGKTTTYSFWSPPKTIEMSESEARVALDARLREVVAEELVADVPVGVFLSGGIDSSTIAWYASKNASRQISTFSIGFDDPAFDESSFARRVASTLGTNHHERVCTVADALSLIPLVPDVFSEPVADPSVLPTLLLSRFAKEQVKVSLGGDGADELFAGYPTFLAERAFGWYRTLPHLMKLGGKALIDLLPADGRDFSLVFTAKKFLSIDEALPSRRHTEWLGSFSKSFREDVLSGSSTPVTAEALFEPADRAYGAGDPHDPLNALLFMYARTYLMDQVLVKVDRASMHYGLEVRAPFLDHRVVDAAFRMPSHLKFRNGSGKYLLKKLMRDRLPEEILTRKKKGFGIPLSTWLKNELRPLCTELLSVDALRSHGLLDARYVERLMHEHFSGRHDHRKLLWNLMTFQMWYYRFIAS